MCVALRLDKSAVVVHCLSAKSCVHMREESILNRGIGSGKNVVNYEVFHAPAQVSPARTQPPCSGHMSEPTSTNILSSCLLLAS